MPEQKPNNHLISIVFSFKNEEEVLRELIRRVKKTFEENLSDYQYEMLFVNDASTDGSISVLKELKPTHPQIKILSMSRTFGNPQCILAGIKYSSGGAVVMMDADLQDPPELIPELVKTWISESADVVYTVRTHREAEPRLKMMATKLGYWVLNRMSSIELPKEAGDFRLMSRRVVNCLNDLNEQEPFVRGLVRWTGFKQVPVFYRREGRFAGETHFIFYRSRVIKNFLSGITSFSDAPLYMMFVGGCILSTLSFLYLAGVLFMKAIGWSLPGWTAIMATLLAFGGIQMLCFGILGLYIAKIHIGVKGRPNFIVMEKDGFDIQ